MDDVLGKYSSEDLCDVDLGRTTLFLNLLVPLFDFIINLALERFEHELQSFFVKRMGARLPLQAPVLVRWAK